jgi:hypothetical protein
MAQVNMAWCWKKGPSYKVFKHWLIGMEAMQTITGTWMSSTSLKQPFLVGGSR